MRHEQEQTGAILASWEKTGVQREITTTPGIGRFERIIAGHIEEQGRSMKS